MKEALIMFFALGLTGGLVAGSPQTPNRLMEQKQSAATLGLAQNIEGSWEGLLSVAGTKLRLLLKISRAPDATLKATIDSLDQPNGNNLQVDSIALQNGALHFEMKAIYVVYDGALSKDGSEIVGTFNKAMLTFEFSHSLYHSLFGKV